jgi:5'(3')-deoxyribonucleotidase
MYAASGLERLMVSGRNNKSIKDSNVAQISAFIYYEASVLSQLESNRNFKTKFKSIIFNQLRKDFSLYIDAQARTKPKSLHHVYEWSKPGNPAARLFDLNFIESSGLSFKLDYQLIDSKSYVPNKNAGKRYKFVKKASVMESGMPVIIAPKSSKRLVFEIDGITVFMPKGASVVVKSPGGTASTNQFKLSYSRFFSGQLVSESLKKSGFQKMFSSGINKSLAVPLDIRKVKYAFSPNTIKSQADASLSLSFGGAL